VFFLDIHFYRTLSGNGARNDRLKVGDPPKTNPQEQSLSRTASPSRSQSHNRCWA
jgi:hypothetical protein